ncbi:hypothetical protein Taro_010245 [Colocasia esculenta]|uniref:Uncharacterized protein n=1 Tax=Colocasia esculenta TaxID=4460 RepID=A0A843U2H6_COLES|nr:hypothetical protein [Colocasia esculenta]
MSSPNAGGSTAQAWKSDQGEEHHLFGLVEEGFIAKIQCLEVFRVASTVCNCKGIKGHIRINNNHTKKQSHNIGVYPGSDLLSLGVLRPVPEQQLRISLTRVQSPYGHYNTQLT